MNTRTTSKIIIALDFSEEKKVLQLLKYLSPDFCTLKIGLEMFTLFGPIFVKQLILEGYRIFLDLKFHDIPHTVAQACSAAAKLGVWMINVHAQGGLVMMRAAREAIAPYGDLKPLLIGVTVLTSMDTEDLLSIGLTQISLKNQVNRLAMLSKEAGLDGVVCSAYEVPEIKKICGSSFLTITPGIRLEEDAIHDQKRVMTPCQAIQQGSDYLVIGRAITAAERPDHVLQKILSMLPSDSSTL